MVSLGYKELIEDFKDKNMILFIWYIGIHSWLLLIWD